MRKYLLLSAAVVFVGSNAWAEEVAPNDCCNDACTCHWSYDADTKTINITGTGAMKDYSYSKKDDGHYHTNSPWQIYETEAESVNIAKGITSIGSATFYEMKALHNVSIPTSVTKISSAAFQYADLRSIVIPEGVKTIGNSAFHANLNLSEVILPSTLESIDIYSFAHAEIETLVIPENVTVLNDIFQGSTDKNAKSYPKLKNFYCTSAQMAQCEAALDYEKRPDVKPMRYEKEGNDYLVYDNKGNIVGKYASIDYLQKGMATETYKYDSAGHLVGIFDGNGQRTWGKKIYTVEEAMEATKDGDRFHVYLTYK